MKYLLRNTLLEKSLQTLLFWLPVPSHSSTELHYLLSTRPGPSGSAVPLKYTHSIKDLALVCARHFAGNGEIVFAQSLEKLEQQFSWLDPLIQQLYRYPFSPTENRSADILRLFNALAYVRRALHQGDSGTKTALQTELKTSPQNLNKVYDQLIQSHINAQVISPVHEILKASQEVIVLLVQLSKPSNI